MKFAVILCALLVAGIAAEPVQVVNSVSKSNDRSIVVQVIKVLFNALRDWLRRIDPLQVDNWAAEITLLDAISIGGRVQELYVSGFSDLTIRELGWNGDALHFDFVFNRLTLSLGNGRAYVGGSDAQGSGRIEITGLGVEGVAVVDRAGLVLGDASLAFKLDGISSDVQTSALGTDYSDSVNDFINNRLHPWVSDNHDRISELAVIACRWIWTQLFNY